MRKALLLIFFWPTFLFGELPSKTLAIAKPEVWTGYTYELLYREFPEEWESLDRLEFRLSSSAELNARMERTIRGYGSITVNLGFILILENEEEYLAILAHELGHFKQKFRATRITCRTMSEMLNMGKPEKIPFLDVVHTRDEYLEMEKEADDFSLITARKKGHDPCSLPNVLSRTFLVENDMVRHRRLVRLCTE